VLFMFRKKQKTVQTPNDGDYIGLPANNSGASGFLYVSAADGASNPPAAISGVTGLRLTITTLPLAIPAATFQSLLYSQFLRSITRSAYTALFLPKTKNPPPPGGYRGELETIPKTP